MVRNQTEKQLRFAHLLFSYSYFARFGSHCSGVVELDYVLQHLFEYYCEHPGEMPEEFVMIGYEDGTERSVCDYHSCMTDRYATRRFTALFAPSSFPAF